MTTLAAAAAVTQRVQLATMIVISPLRNTTLLAKAARTVNALSNGRFTLGISIGARRDDYELANVPYQKRGSILDQQLLDLNEYWDNEAIGPQSSDRPRLMIGGLSDVTFGRVARFADGYMHNGGPPRIFERNATQARAAWADASRPGQPKLWGMGYFAFGETAVAAGADYLRDYYAFTGPFAERIVQGLLTTPQAVAQYVRGYTDAGCDNLILFPVTAELAQLHQLADIIG
jgi:alkanesulfonate monooxygenase SsuD/methylene tetrahydromethanopterin reductase-like flavin-dependent oxidoreductase (luciferase family)